MKKLFIPLLITLTGLAVQNAWAQSDTIITKPTSSGFVTVKIGDKSTSGTVLNADTTKSYLEDFCGLVGTTSGNTTTWAYKKDSKGKYVKPKSQGDVFFVEVNDYWMGVNNQNTADYYD